MGTSSEFRSQLFGGRADRRQDLEQSGRNAHRIGQVAASSLHGPSDPPCGIRRELEPLPPVEFLNSRDQAEVAFLNQVEHVDIGAAVAPRIGDDQTEIRLDELVSGRYSSPHGAFQQGALWGFDLIGPVQTATRDKPCLHVPG